MIARHEHYLESRERSKSNHQIWAKEKYDTEQKQLHEDIERRKCIMKKWHKERQRQVRRHSCLLFLKNTVENVYQNISKRGIFRNNDTSYA